MTDEHLEFYKRFLDYFRFRVIMKPKNRLKVARLFKNHGGWFKRVKKLTGNQNDGELIPHTTGRMKYITIMGENPLIHGDETKI